MTDVDKEALDRLQEEYFEASAKDRDKLRPTLVQKMRDAYPGALETFERTIRDGSLMLSMFKHNLRSALLRPGLSKRQKTNLIEDALEFYATHRKIKNSPNGLCTREDAFGLTRTALLVSEMVWLDSNEIEWLRKQFMSEHQRKVRAKGVADQRNKEWRKYAKDAALRLHKANRALTLTDIAEKIDADWEPEKFEKVGRQQLFKYLSKQVDDGELPSSMKKPARKGRHEK
jgi:hypothetical protein